MTMTGEQWLEQVFRRSLSIVDEVRGRPDVLKGLGGKLFAQVEALGDTGVLTEEQETAALDALEAAGILPVVESRSATTSAEAGGVPVAARAGSPIVATPAPDGPPRLLGVLAGPRELGRLDGRPVVLISAELWSDRFLIDLYADPGPEFRAGRARANREQLDWIRRAHRGHRADRPAGTRFTSPLRNLTWDLRDAQGTGYRRTGGGAEASDYLDRVRTQWSPAPSVAGETLTLRATDGTGTVVLTAEVPRPRE